MINKIRNYQLIFKTAVTCYSTTLAITAEHHYGVSCQCVVTSFLKPH